MIDRHVGWRGLSEACPRSRRGTALRALAPATRKNIHAICSKQKRPTPFGLSLRNTPERIRTSDLLLRRQALYPAELRVLVIVRRDYTSFVDDAPISRREKAIGQPDVAPVGSLVDNRHRATNPMRL